MTFWQNVGAGYAIAAGIAFLGLVVNVVNQNWNRRAGYVTSYQDRIPDARDVMNALWMVPLFVVWPVILGLGVRHVWRGFRVEVRAADEIRARAAVTRGRG